MRSLYNDVTFIDEFLTEDFAIEHKLFTFDWSVRNDRFEIASREFRSVKEKLLSQLTNFGNPFILTISAMGHDVLTAMGARNISLVAGGVSDLQVGPFTLPKPVIAQLTLPEPRFAAQLAAGAIALLVIAGSRARTRR